MPSLHKYVYVVIIHEDSVDSLKSSTFVHLTLEGAHKNLTDYVGHLNTFEWSTETPRLPPSFQEFKAKLHLKKDPVHIYKHGDYTTDRFTIEVVVQRVVVNE